MKELAYLNGEFCPIADAKISIEDRGFQFGDGVYEVVAVYDGRPFLLDRHMARLQRSLDAICLNYKLTNEPLEPIIAEGLRRSAPKDSAMVYIQITRGPGPRSHLEPEGLVPTVVMTFKPMEDVPAAVRQSGTNLMSVTDIRWANCFVKAITLLPNVLAKNEAVRNGFDDALFVTPSGEVRECTSANIGIVTDGSIRIPPRSDAVLHGVTQSFVMECAEALNIPLTERTFDLETLYGADEVFKSSTTQDVLGVTRVDDRAIADGKPGPVTTALFNEFRSRLQTVLSTNTPTSVVG